MTDDTPRILQRFPTATCRHCGHTGIRVEERLEARPVGSHSLAGVQVKFSARWWPYAVCDGCGHTSRGEV